MFLQTKKSQLDLFNRNINNNRQMVFKYAFIYWNRNNG